MIADVLAGRARWHVEHADCRSVLAALAPDAVVHVITDPPYSDHVHAKQWIGAALTDEGAPRVKTAHRELGFEALSPELRALVALEARRVASRWSMFFCDIEGVHGWIEDVRAAELDYVRTIVWDKVDSAPQFSGDRPGSAAECLVVAHRTGRKKWNGGGRRNVLRHAVNAEKGGKPHPSTKPLPLMMELVELFTDPDDLVLDPFAGSGTTGVACVRLGRRFIGCEKDARFHAIAIERLEAEERGLTLNDARAGQTSLLDLVRT